MPYLKYLNPLQSTLSKLYPDSSHQQIIYIIKAGNQYRWILPAFKSNIYNQLKCWTPYSLKSKFYWFLLITSYRLRFLRYLSCVVSLKTYLPEQFVNCCVYIGTPGPNQKLVITNCSSNKIIKVGIGLNANTKLENEYNILLHLTKLQFPCPKPLSYHKNLKCVIQSKSDGHLISYKFTRNHLELLKKMPTTGILSNVIQIMPDLHKYYTRFQFIYPKFRDLIIPKGTKFIFQHGDFCAWNILYFNKKLSLIDLEEGTMLGLVLFDYMYFHARYCQLFSRKDVVVLLIKECRELLPSLDNLEDHILLVQSYMIYISLKKDDIDFALFINNSRFILK